MNKSLIIAAALVASTSITTTTFASTHKVTQGETLYSISKTHNISVDDLKLLNNLSSTTIRVGQILQLSATSTNTTNVASTEYYLVKKGDTFSSIARNHGLSMSELAKLNPTITNTSAIYVNQKIIVSKMSSSTQSPNSNTVVTNSNSTKYLIKSGDTLSKIAVAHKTSVNELLRLNPSITEPSKIYVGQSIIVPTTNTGLTTVSPNTSNTIANAVINAGAKYLGAKYLYGASVSRFDAFDCSSFTYRAFIEGANITLPRTATQQAKLGTTIPFNSLQLGDLVFFDTSSNGTISHVGIYVGNGQMINAATSKGVSYASITSGYWKERYVKAQRILK